MSLSLVQFRTICQDNRVKVNIISLQGSGAWCRAEDEEARESGGGGGGGRGWVGSV